MTGGGPRRALPREASDREKLAVEVGHLSRIADADQLALVQQEAHAAKARHGGAIVGDEQDRLSRILECAEPAEALLLEPGVANGQRLVDDQHLRVDVESGGERNAHEHARRMRFHRLFEELADVGEGLDVRHPVHDLHSRETHDRAVEDDVFTGGQVRIESRAELQERRHLAGHAHRSRRRLQDGGDDLEQRRLSRAVHAEDADGVAAADGEADVAERPEFMVEATASRIERLSDPGAFGWKQLVLLGHAVDADRRPRRAH